MSNAAYLSIIEWPDQLTEHDRVVALASAMGTDEYSAMLIVRRGTPQVACKLAVERAPGALDALRARGAVAFAPTRDAIDALPDATPVKRLVPGKSHAAEVEPWRAPAFALNAAEIELMVIGKVRSTLVAGGTSGASSGAADAVRAIGTAAIGLPLTALGGSDSAQPAPHGTDQMTTVLDVWLSSRRLRFVSNRLDTEPLAALAAPGARFDLASNHDRVDLLSRWLARAAPTIDRGFREFHCPPDVLVTTTSTSSAGTMKRRTDHAPLFEFYSRWVSMLYKKLRSGS